ncbi:MAG: glycosyltransferase, partial [Gemmatimonadetes bacterium]|nr:glycosyltransferase [Gemmatimonadota bacterium]
MRALVIAPQPFFSPRGTPFSVYYRTLITAEEGVDVDLLTYGDGDDVEIPGVRIHRIPRFPVFGAAPVGPSALKAFLDIFIALWTVGLLLRHRYDFVHAHEEAVFLAWFLKPLFRFRLVYDMHSCLPQQLSNFKFTTSKAVIRSFEWLEDRCLESADAVITICPDLAEYATGRMTDFGKHVLIENSIFEPVNLKDAGQDGGTGGGASARGSAGAVSAAAPALPPVPAERPVVIYAGTFESYQGLEILLEGFAIAARTAPEAFLLMVGGAPEQVEHYRRIAREAGLVESEGADAGSTATRSANVHFTGRVAPDVARALNADAA